MKRVPCQLGGYNSVPTIYRDRPLIQVTLISNTWHVNKFSAESWAHTGVRLSQRVQRAVTNYGLSKLHARLRGSRVEDSWRSNSDRNYPALPYPANLGWQLSLRSLRTPTLLYRPRVPLGRRTLYAGRG